MPLNDIITPIQAGAKLALDRREARRRDDAFAEEIRQARELERYRGATLGFQALQEERLGQKFKNEQDMERKMSTFYRTFAAGVPFMGARNAAAVAAARSGIMPPQIASDLLSGTTSQPRQQFGYRDIVDPATGATSRIYFQSQEEVDAFQRENAVQNMPDFIKGPDGKPTWNPDKYPERATKRPIPGSEAPPAQVATPPPPGSIPVQGIVPEVAGTVGSAVGTVAGPVASTIGKVAGDVGNEAWSALRASWKILFGGNLTQEDQRWLLDKAVQLEQSKRNPIQPKGFY